MKKQDPIEILSQGHHKGQNKLMLLQRAIDLLGRRDAAGAIPLLRDTLAFFNGDLKTHFFHEEAALFPVLSRAIGPMGPIGAMLEEHKSFWHVVEALEEAFPDVERGSPEALKEAAAAAAHILQLLISHIEKEEKMLFPLARKHLTPQAMEEVGRQMQSTPGI